MDSKIQKLLYDTTWEKQQLIYTKSFSNWTNLVTVNVCKNTVYFFLLWLYNPIYYRFPIHNMFLEFKKTPLHMQVAIHKNLFFKSLLIKLVQEFETNETIQEAFNKIMNLLEKEEEKKEWKLNPVLLDRIRDNLICLHDQIHLPIPTFLFQHFPVIENRWNYFHEAEQRALLAAKKKKEDEAKEEAKQKELKLKRKQIPNPPRYWTNLKQEERKTIKEAHMGYPLPHPTLGQPKLSMLECRYKDCEFKAETEYILDQHLRVCCGTDFIQGLHRSHALIVESMKLTPELILQEKKKYSKCPSLVCNKSHLALTALELIYHFEELGIAPFWKPGWTPKTKTELLELKKEGLKEEENELKEKEQVEEKEEEKKEEIIIPSPPIPQLVIINIDNHLNIHRENEDYEETKQTDKNECICCYDSRRNIVFMPCLHQVLCYECIKKMSLPITCAVCRTKVEYVIPTLF